jgi:hypothetical protein
VRTWEWGGGGGPSHQNSVLNSGMNSELLPFKYEIDGVCGFIWSRNIYRRYLYYDWRHRNYIEFVSLRNIAFGTYIYRRVELYSVYVGLQV